MKQEITYVVIKHLFNGTFWNGEDWVIPSFTDNLNTYPSIISEDCYLQQLEKISDVDKEHCVLSEITQIIQLVF